MSLEELMDLVHDLVLASGDTPYGITPNQKFAIVCLLKDYSTSKNVTALFAVPDGDDWFRHKALHFLFGVDSTSQLTLSQASALITLLKSEEDWTLSCRGRGALDLVLGELVRTHPVQESLL